jgi:NAD(P)H dehydrogenase (quinone)
MKILVIYAHPTGVGHHAYFLEKFTEKLKQKECSYEVLDLYQMNFNPILTKTDIDGTPDNQVLEFKEKVSESDRLVFIFPTWWQGMPAIMKGFFDRVFSAGFAFKYQNGLPIALLKSKRAIVFSATGGPKIINDFILRRKGMRVVVGDILKFCGVCAKGFSIGSARKLTEKNKIKIDSLVVKAYEYLVK